MIAAHARQTGATWSRGLWAWCIAEVASGGTKLYYVYILASISRVLYIGVTGSFEKRINAHRAQLYSASFTSRYNVTRLVYFEEYQQVEDAIAREKQMKGGGAGRR